MNTRIHVNGLSVNMMLVAMVCLRIIFGGGMLNLLQQGLIQKTWETIFTQDKIEEESQEIIF